VRGDGRIGTQCLARADLPRFLPDIPHGALYRYYARRSAQRVLWKSVLWLAAMCFAGRHKEKGPARGRGPLDHSFQRVLSAVGPYDPFPHRVAHQAGPIS